MTYRTMGELMDEETYRVLKLLNPDTFDSHKLLFSFGMHQESFMMELEPEYILIGFRDSTAIRDFAFFLQEEAHIAPILLSRNQCHIPYSLVIDTPWMRTLPGYIAHFFYKRYV